jgi:hypothetical protein
MKKSSDNAVNLNLIVNVVGQALRPLKFRNSGKRFNRIQSDGIVHVVDFQLGPNWSMMWGKFTVEIGIFLPEVFNAFFDKAAPKFIPSHDCFERKRLGILGKDGKDIWWDLPGDSVKIGNEVLGLLVGEGECYFSQFSSREKIISAWESKRSHGRLSQREVVILAVIYSYLAEKERANELLVVEFAGQYKTAFLEYARNVITPLGLTFPLLK